LLREMKNFLIPENSWEIKLWGRTFVFSPHTKKSFENSDSLLENMGAWDSVVFKALRYYSGGPGIDSRWCHWGLFPWLRTKQPCAMGSTQHLKMSTRDFFWGKGDRCGWLTTYYHRSGERQENPGP
jgi:hypothetical protein